MAEPANHPPPGETGTHSPSALETGRIYERPYPAAMTTAAAVPRTHGELEGDEALETLRRTGRRRLLLDSVTRFRAADGFSHSRALAFQITLTLLPALIAVVGLAEALESGDLPQGRSGDGHHPRARRGRRPAHRGAATGDDQRAAGVGRDRSRGRFPCGRARGHHRDGAGRAWGQQDLRGRAGPADHPQVRHRSPAGAARPASWACSRSSCWWEAPRSATRSTSAGTSTSPGRSRGGRSACSSS